MPLMRHPTTLTFFIILFSLNFALGQNSTLSKHEFRFYVNEIEQLNPKAELSIIIAKDTIKAIHSDNFYYFPAIDTSQNFDIIVKVDTIIFSGQGIRSWVLNKGTRILFGKLTQLNKLQSVAEYNGMTKNDKGWEWYSKRFFILDHFTTLDIDNRDKINELQFLLLYPNNSNSNVSIQKTIK